MPRKKNGPPGYGKLLDAWTPPETAGDPIGCVATSFTFSPVFFEEECLGRFLQLETDPTEDGPLYLVEREEKLAQVSCIVALVDQHHCRGKRSLRWDLLPARIPHGILHAKVSILHWAQLVRVVVASANLTEDGYRRNQEIFGVLNYEPDGTAPLACLHDLVGFLRDAGRYSQSTTDLPSPALQRWDAFLDRIHKTAKDWGDSGNQPSRRGTRIQVVLSGPERPNVLDALADAWPASTPPDTAAVVSPFFDPPEAVNEPARGLWKRLRRRGNATVRYRVSAEEIPGDDTILVHAPESLLRAEPTGRSGVATEFYQVELEPNRPLHAKGIWLEDSRDDGWVTYLVGSSNFTSPGLGLGHRVNLEANLLYMLRPSGGSDPAMRALQATLPEVKQPDLEQNLKWQARPIGGEDDAADELGLPTAFECATYDCDDRQEGRVTFTFSGQPPAGWILTADGDEVPFLTEATWQEQDSCSTIVRRWSHDRPPPGFWVRWQGCPGRAWWPVNVLSPNILPPPQELKNLPFEVLMNILTSARPLHRVLREHGRRVDRNTEGDGEGKTELDPHKRVDTSQFLLQRTHRVSWALTGLRRRLERPVSTRECLQWRLRGPVGVIAFADALAREARSEEERAFLISELALEIARAHPESAAGWLSSDLVRKELRTVARELRDRIPRKLPLELENLKRYVGAVFESIVR